MTWHQQFPRRIDSLQAIFDGTGCWGRDQQLSAPVQFRLDFVIEELFTNLVKYGGGSAPIGLRLERHGLVLRGELDDPDGRSFDPGQAPTVDTAAPIEQRRPGGLGVHLVAHLTERVEAGIDAVSGHARITFFITVPAADERPASSRSEDHVED